MSETGNFELIWRTVADIPYGHVATYGQIAELAGLPRRARLVGQALKHTPKRLRIPWHRVINAQGMISFPQNSEPFRRQKALLMEEGVEFIGQRIVLERFRWRPSLDELLWKPHELDNGVS